MEIDEEEKGEESEGEESDKEEFEEDGMPKDYKELRVAVHSMRLDSLIKAALGEQRSRLEEAVLSGKIMINGCKALKKAHELVRGDTVDFVVGPSPDNPDFTVVKRFMITNVEGTTKGKKAVDLRKWNSMVVDDYSSARKDKDQDDT